MEREYYIMEVEGEGCYCLCYDDESGNRVVIDWDLEIREKQYMKIKLSRDCLLECWSGLEEGTPIPFKRGDTFEVEVFNDEYYVKEGDEDFGDIYIPKLSCAY